MAQPRTGTNLPSLPRAARIGVVLSTYHAEIGAAMLESARSVLEAAGLGRDDLLVVEAPGAFELPLIARRLAVRDDVKAVLCFGLVLKGETRHDEFVAAAAADGIQQAALHADKPILFGVLTCDRLEQALARSLPASRGGKFDKGAEVARAAIAAIVALERAASIGAPLRAAGFRSAEESR